MFGLHNPQWKERTDCSKFSLASTHSLRTSCTALRPHACLRAHIHPHMIHFYRRGRTNTYKARICEKNWQDERQCCPHPAVHPQVRLKAQHTHRWGTELLRGWYGKAASNPGGISPCNAEMPGAGELHKCFYLTRLLHTLILLRSYTFTTVLPLVWVVFAFLLGIFIIPDSTSMWPVPWMSWWGHYMVLSVPICCFGGVTFAHLLSYSYLMLQGDL